VILLIGLFKRKKNNSLGAIALNEALDPDGRQKLTSSKGED
jgi:hypothetical protein